MVVCAPDEWNQLLELKDRVDRLAQNACAEATADQNPVKKARLNTLSDYLALDWSKAVPQPKTDHTSNWHSLSIADQITAVTQFLSPYKSSLSDNDQKQVVEGIQTLIDQIEDEAELLKAEGALLLLLSTLSVSERKEALVFRFRHF